MSHVKGRHVIFRSTPAALLRQLAAVAALLTILAVCSVVVHAQPIASVDDSVRASDSATGFVLNNDFSRLFFVTNPAPVTNIGRTDKVYKGKLVQARAFMSATILYQPPLSVIDDAHYVGADDTSPDTSDLVAMRCRPQDAGQLRPVLASWPNLFAATVSDLSDLMGYTPDDCPNNDMALDESDPVDLRVYCAALDFKDRPNKIVPLSLQPAIDTGATIFQLTGLPFQATGSTTGANVLFDLYLVGSGFSGLGFAVRDSFLRSKGGNIALTAAQTLEQSVVTEYLVENVPLSEGNCRCVRVKPYRNRDQRRLNWQDVWGKGRLDRTDGHCVERDHL